MLRETLYHDKLIDPSIVEYNISEMEECLFRTAPDLYGPFYTRTVADMGNGAWLGWFGMPYRGLIQGIYTQEIYISMARGGGEVAPTGGDNDQ